MTSSEKIEPKNQQRNILITGSAKGLGRSMALHLAQTGTRLWLHYFQSEAEAQSLAKEVQAKGAETELIKADLGQEVDREQIFAKMHMQTDRLDILINNVGLYDGRGLLEFSPSDWRNTLATGPEAVFHLTQLAKDLLHNASKATGGARVINLGDSGSDRLVARVQATPYHVAKAGIQILTRSFAKELAPLGITVNQISPGFFENSVGEPGSPIPAGRKGLPSDLIPALDYLLSREAQYITGTNLVISGGWNL